LLPSSSENSAWAQSSGRLRASSEASVREQAEVDEGDVQNEDEEAKVVEDAKEEEAILGNSDKLDGAILLGDSRSLDLEMSRREVQSDAAGDINGEAASSPDTQTIVLHDLGDIHHKPTNIGPRIEGSP